MRFLPIGAYGTQVLKIDRTIPVGVRICGRPLAPRLFHRFDGPVDAGAVFSLSASFTQAKTDTVTVGGKAAIFNDNLLDAKDRAKNDALRNAVEQVAGVLAASKSKFLNSLPLKDLILTQTAGYVRSCEILSE